jgi:ABC-type dipeptide/oligopeptide/nickel transport system permease subunit
MLISIIVFILSIIIGIMIAGILSEYFKGIEIIFEKILCGLYSAGKSVGIALKDILSNKKEIK